MFPPLLSPHLPPDLSPPPVGPFVGPPVAPPVAPPVPPTCCPHGLQLRPQVGCVAIADSAAFGGGRGGVPPGALASARLQHVPSPPPFVFLGIDAGFSARETGAFALCAGHEEQGNAERRPTPLPLRPGRGLNRGPLAPQSCGVPLRRGLPMRCSRRRGAMGLYPAQGISGGQWMRDARKTPPPSPSPPSHFSGGVSPPAHSNPERGKTGSHPTPPPLRHPPPAALPPSISPR